MLTAFQPLLAIINTLLLRPIPEYSGNSFRRVQGIIAANVEEKAYLCVMGP